MPSDPLKRETSKLYALPPNEFTAARNVRARELRKDDPELAAAVAKLPKPTLSAAALNELAREDPSEVRALVQAGKRLRAAQEGAVQGKGVDLDAAIREHREALERVRRDLRRRELSDATLERALRTVRVASLDPDLHPLLERGLLHEDLEASGFGLDPGIVPARPSGKRAAAAPARAKDDRKERERRRREAERRLREAEAALAEAERQAKAAQRELERAVAEVERARRAVDDAG